LKNNWEAVIEFENMPDDADVESMMTFLMALLESDGVEYKIKKLEKVKQ